MSQEIPVNYYIFITYLNSIFVRANLWRPETKGYTRCARTSRYHLIYTIRSPEKTVDELFNEYSIWTDVVDDTDVLNNGVGSHHHNSKQSKTTGPLVP